MSEANATPRVIDAPSWPTDSISPSRAGVDYYVPADEFLVYFGGRPVPKVSSLLGGPGFEDVAVMIGLGPNGEKTGEIVGVHAMSMLVGAVQDKPHWAILAWAAMAGDYGAELLHERLPEFLAEVHDAFDRYWTAPPPIEEQMAAIERMRHQEQG